MWRWNSRRTERIDHPRATGRHRANACCRPGLPLVLVGALAGPAWAAAANASVAVAPALRDEVLLLAVRVNGVERDDTVAALRSDGFVALNADDWKALTLRPPGTAALPRDGRDYFRLDALPGMRWRIDELSQTLVIDAPASAFSGLSTTLDASTATPVQTAAWGGMLNYDLQWQRSSTPGAARDEQGTQGLLEFGAFGPGGSARFSGLVRDNGMKPHTVRLDTTWTQDHPDRMASLRIGDDVGYGGAWGRALRFGGVRWASDFSTQPGFITFPLPAMRGEAVLPSTVDVYVNNSRRLQGQVPAGPFELTDLPLVTGSGQVRVVVRDLLGREQVIVQPYYASPALLRTGLRAFSYEIGSVREDYGLSSANYGKLMAAATERLGVSDTFTRELRAEALDRQVAVGATGMWLLPETAMLNLSAVGSHSRRGNGLLLSAAGEHRCEDWNGSVQVRRSSPAFEQMGQGSGPAPRTQASVAVGATWGGVSVGMGYVQQSFWQGEQQRVLSVNLARSLGRFGTLGVFALRDRDSPGVTVALSLSVALDARASAALTYSRGQPGLPSATTLQVQGNVPEGSGVGYQLGVERGGSERTMAQAMMRAEVADFTAGAAHTRHGSSTVQMGASGGVAWLDDSVFLSRRIDSSFALVEVGDYPDVQVLLDHRPVARTDRHGRALVPGLRAYQSNRIGVDAANLPFDAEVDALELDLVPPARSGVVQRIPVRRSRAASFRLVDAHGAVLPAGTLLQIAGQAQTFPVGFDGRGYVSGLALSTQIHARGASTRCSAVLELAQAPDADELPDLGTVSCR